MSETALLQGTRDWLRQACGFEENECEVEFDEMAMTGVGSRYIVVMPGDWSTGPNNNIGGGVLDEIYGVDVCVVVRAAGTPRDRKRNLLLENIDGLNALSRKVRAAIHFSIPLMGAVNSLVTDSAEKFIETLKFGGQERRPRVVGPDFFAARPGEHSAGLARTMTFRGARRLQSVGQLK